MPQQAPEPQQPIVTTEPQRQALDAMSQALVEKLNRMVEEQHQRVEEFTRMEHSLSQRPIEFRMPENMATRAAGTDRPIEPADFSHQAGSISAAEPSGNAAAPSPAQAGKRKPLPPVPPIPPVPPAVPQTSATRQASAAQQAAAGTRLRRSPSDTVTGHYPAPQRNGSAQNSAREPGTLSGLLELLGLGSKDTAETDKSEEALRRTYREAADRDNSKGCLYAVFIIFALIFMARSCS